MGEVAVENINVAEILNAEGAAERVEQVKAALAADPKASLLMKTAETAEDVYEIIKGFAKATLEQVKVIFQKTVDYYKQAKVELSDELLDNVVGGWSFSSWWNQNKSDIIGGAIFATCLIGGVIIGACTGGLGGAVIGAAAGFAIGATLGGVAGLVTYAVDNSQ